LDKIDSEIIALLKSMEGVVHTGIVPDRLRKKLLEQEERFAALGPIAVDNIGVRTAVQRERLYYVVKNKRFRPPPIATVQLVAEDGTVLGEELIKGREPITDDGERLLYLGKDFIIQCSKAKAKGKNSKFILPPVPFPEIERLGIARNVVSSSPSTLGDMDLKKEIGIDDDPKLASILIGLDALK
jgi:hypothetical protein